MRRKVISILTATAMVVTFIPTFAFAVNNSDEIADDSIELIEAEEQYDCEMDEEELDDSDDALQDSSEECYIDLEGSGELTEEEEQNMQKFIEEFEEQATFTEDEIIIDNVDMDYFEEKYGDEIVEITEDRVDEINELADDGELEISDDGAIVMDDNMSIQGKVNITKTEFYWWGSLNYMSYSRANTFISSLDPYVKAINFFKKAAAGVAGSGAISNSKANGMVSAFWAANNSLVNYVKTFKSKLKAKNVKKKGVKYKMYYTSKYVVRTQGKSF